MPLDGSHWWNLLSTLRGAQKPAKSLYLPTNPPRKFPPRTLPLLPSEAIINLAAVVGFQTIFPFVFGDKEGYPNDIPSFDAVIQEMSTDRSFVINRPLVMSLSEDSKVTQSFKLQCRFSQHLLERVNATLKGVHPSIASPYNFLVDLLGQAFSHRDKLRIQVDDVGAHWVRLRKTPPYRKGSFYENVTVHVHHVLELIDIVYGETDDDIDTEYQYEWMAGIIRDFMEGRSPNPT
jgi:hypothetical protein